MFQTKSIKYATAEVSHLAGILANLWNQGLVLTLVTYLSTATQSS